MWPKRCVYADGENVALQADAGFPTLAMASMMMSVIALRVPTFTGMRVLTISVLPWILGSGLSYR